MSDAAKAERARRMERWAETAMAKLLETPSGEAATSIAKRAWEFAAYMEDQRTSVLAALAGLEPQDPRMPPEKPSWER